MKFFSRTTPYNSANIRPGLLVHVKLLLTDNKAIFTHTTVVGSSACNKIFAVLSFLSFDHELEITIVLMRRLKIMFYKAEKQMAKIIHFLYDSTN